MQAASQAGFAERLHDRIRATTNSAVCLGLDPRPDWHPLTHPQRHGGSEAAIAAAVADYLGAVVRATSDLVCCCKPQLAFFEALGPAGFEVLSGLLELARSLGLPVILDGKRGDIGSTAEAYAQAYFAGGRLAADALTVNPYLGMDSLEPFIGAAERSGGGLFVLVKTSNPGGKDLQELELAAGGPVYLHLARSLTGVAAALPKDRDGYTLLGAVVGATNDRQTIAGLRAALPNSVLLLPGHGAQGGGLSAAAAGFDSQGLGAVVSASRSLTYPAAAQAATDLAEVGKAARAATMALRDGLRRALELS